MSIAEFERIVSMLSPANELFYLHFIGEPLLHPELPQMVRMCKALGLRVGMFTNAALLTNQIAKSLMRSGLDRMAVSFDVDKEIYDEFRPGGSYHRVKDNILGFLELRERLGLKLPEVVMYSITTLDSDQEPETFWRLKVDRFIQKMQHDWDGQNADITNKLKKERGLENRVCKLPWEGMVILVNGDVVPCCYDARGRNVLGNVHETTLKDIWNGTELRRLRKSHLTGRTSEIPLCSRCISGPLQGDIPRPLFFVKYLTRVFASRLGFSRTHK